MENLHAYWPEIAALVGVGIWMLRLEGKVLAVEKLSDVSQDEIKNMDEKLTQFDSKVLNKLSEIAERLSYIEGSLKGMVGRAKK